MNDQYANRLEDLFQAASDMDPAGRQQFLAEECKNDPALLAEVRALLASDDTARCAEFWSSSAIQIEAKRAAQTPAIEPGRVIGGRYRILSVISSGGMGTVYRAVRSDEEYQKVVALKLIKRGMDTDLIVRRFRTERQILANLQHPNIAALLDGGTADDGTPYLVMEYVEGEPITEYADRRNLTTTDRLDLFRIVCSAVEYAHQNLVIHRDLKPRNILVTADGVPKLLDFGIAKLLSPDESAHEATVTVLRFMTPEYASPEQVRGEPITTVSDVYSLGVLLYRLLTGRRPYRLRTRHPDAIAEAICAQEPEKPSAAIYRVEPADSPDADTATAADVSAVRDGDPESLRRCLRGDLDTIVLMALRKEPARRYSSVAQLSDDIRRHLDGLPVHAQPDTLRYRAGKFIQRNSTAVAAAAIVLLSLIVGIVATTRNARSAQLETARAQRRFQDVRNLANSYIFEIEDSLAGVPGTLAARQVIVERAVTYLDRLAQQAEGDRPLLAELAAAYDRVGTITFNVPKCLTLHRKALAISEGLVQAEPANALYHERLAESAGEVAQLLREDGQPDEALEYCRRAAGAMETLSRLNPKKASYQTELADKYEWLGVVLSQLGDYDGALDSDRKALALTRPLADAHPQSALYRDALMNTYFFLARTDTEAGDARSGLEAARQALQLALSLNAADPQSATYRRDVWVARYRIAAALQAAGDLPAALIAYRKALPYIEALGAADPGDRGHLRNIAITYLGIADGLAATGNRETALENYGTAIAMSEGLYKLDPAKAETVTDLAKMYTRLSRIYMDDGEFTDALAALDRARSLLEQQYGRNRSDCNVQRALAQVYGALGDARHKSALQRRDGALRRQQETEALGWYERSLTRWLDLQSAHRLRNVDSAAPGEVRARIAEIKADMASN